MKRVSPKKHLGQHFLKDDAIAQKIVGSLVSETGHLIEVGPGMGVLTQHLLNRSEFEACDVDKESIAYLKNRFPEHEKKFVLEDFLRMKLPESSFSVIGNFPYNISSQIFFRVYDHRQSVREVVGMLQKEVAERIAAPHGNKTYGILSVLLQAFYKVEYLFSVDSGVFDPPPKVMSAVVRLSRNEREQLDCDEDLFKRVVKLGFGKRRKTLRNALKELALPISLSETEVFGQRAEQLSVQEFINLTRSISESWKQ